VNPVLLHPRPLALELELLDLKDYNGISGASFVMFRDILSETARNERLNSGCVKEMKI